MQAYLWLRSIFIILFGAIGLAAISNGAANEAGCAVKVDYPQWSHLRTEALRHATAFSRLPGWKSDLQLLNRTLSEIDTGLYTLSKSTAAVCRNRGLQSQMADKVRGWEKTIKSLEEKLASVADDAQLSNMGLQSLLNNQQQALALLSEIAKMLHELSVSLIKKIGG